MNPSPISELDHVDGPSDAAVTLIEYGDYECPFCAKAFPIIEAVRAALPGQVRFVYRHVPKSSSHGFAKQAAEAAEFAAAHGQFWAMNKQLFTHPEEQEMAQLVDHARAIGLDPADCQAVLTGGAFRERVREISVASVRSGIIGTPTLFINGEHYNDRMEEAPLHAAVVAALGAAGKR